MAVPMASGDPAPLDHLSPRAADNRTIWFVVLLSVMLN